MVYAVALFLLGCVAGLVGGLRLTRWRRAESDPAPDAWSPIRRPEHNPARVLRSGSTATSIDRDADELVDELRPFLHDVARQHGADEVTLWRHAAGDAGGYDIVAWSGEGPPPAAAGWGNAAERALVEWSATEQMVGFERRDDEPTVAICPVKFASGEPTGAIVFRAEAKFATTRDDLRDWMPRHAAQVRRHMSLFTTRNEVARQSRYTRALLRIARDLQKVHEPRELKLALCDYACEVTGGDFAALVRWDATERSGRIAACTSDAPALLSEGTVTASSLVGAACADASAAFWEDARFLTERGGVLRDDDGGLAAGSFVVLPLVRGGHAIGALLVGAARPGVLRGLELRNGSILAALAVNALDAAWELAETSLRSRTDALTGLWNRRHFDEQLKRVLDETDRFGNSCALVICDIDFFKRVNDTYGHDAGDAVLVQVAEALRETVRTVDVCARIGGEELAVILPQTSPEGAVELAERLRLRIESLAVPHDGVTVRVTASVGVSTYGAGEAGKSQLFKRADEKLYLAKNSGRNRVEA